MFSYMSEKEAALQCEILTGNAKENLLLYERKIKIYNNLFPSLLTKNNECCIMICGKTLGNREFTLYKYIVQKPLILYGRRFFSFCFNN